MSSSYLRARAEILRTLEENERDLVRREMQFDINSQFNANQINQQLYSQLNTFQERNQQLQRQLEQDFSKLISNSIKQEQYKPCNEEYKSCGENCSICLEEIKNDGHKTSCNHHFHKKCLSSWKNTGKNTCPNCRSNL